MSAMVATLQLAWRGLPPTRYAGQEIKLGGYYSFMGEVAPDPQLTAAILAHYNGIPGVTAQAVPGNPSRVLVTIDVYSGDREETGADGPMAGEYLATVTRPFTVRFLFTEDGGIKATKGELVASIV